MQRPKGLQKDQLIVSHNGHPISTRHSREQILCLVSVCAREVLSTSVGGGDIKAEFAMLVLLSQLELKLFPFPNILAKSNNFLDSVSPRF